MMDDLLMTILDWAMTLMCFSMALLVLLGVVAGAALLGDAMGLWTFPV